jgi:hypothetical protein
MLSAKQAVMAAFDDAEWHLSLWYPRVTREVLGLAPSIPDAEIQRALRELVDEGALEAGAVDGAEFAPRPLTLTPGPCPDLFLRPAAIHSKNWCAPQSELSSPFSSM